MKPFEASKIGGQFDVVVDVLGGGVTGQAGAISHGIARAFAQLDNPLRVTMRKEGLLTRDPRMVETQEAGSVLKGSQALPVLETLKII